MIIAGLGALRFEIGGLDYQELERRFDYRWTPQERLGRRPAQQFLGPGEETITLKGVIYPNHPLFRNSLSELNRLRSSAMSGAFFNFGVNVGGGVGRFLGRWCIKSISDSQSIFRGGTPSKVEFTVELVEYGQDNGNFMSFF